MKQRDEKGEYNIRVTLKYPYGQQHHSLHNLPGPRLQHIQLWSVINTVDLVISVPADDHQYMRSVMAPQKHERKTT